MTRYRKLQKELISKAMDPEDILVEEVRYGRIYGALYVKKGAKPRRGVLLAHGMSGNRYGLDALARRLAAFGFLCLSVDLPSHAENPTKFSLGEISETIIDGVVLMKGEFGLSRVSVVGHSIGAVGTIFANAGYTTRIEQNLYAAWHYISEHLEEYYTLNIEGYGKKAEKEATAILEKYDFMKQLILTALKQVIAEKANISSMVLLAPPLNVKSAIPGLSLLNKLPEKWSKPIFEFLMHKPGVNVIMKEGNVVGYRPDEDKSKVHWLFFKADASEFMEYFLKMKEPADFLQLIEAVRDFRHKDDKVSFFDYYYKKYLLPTPKFFIYGKRDLYLKPFLPFARGRLERYYESCGNAEIYYGDFSHVMVENPKQQTAGISVRDPLVTEKIILFLDKNT